MDGIIFLTTVFAVLLAFDVLAARFGVDSSFESDDPHSPGRGLTV